MMLVTKAVQSVCHGILLKYITKVCRWNYSNFETIIITMNCSRYSVWQIIVYFVLCKATLMVIRKAMETYW